MQDINGMIDFFLYEKGESIILNGSEQVALVMDAVDKLTYYDDKLIRCKCQIKTGDIIEYNNFRYIIISQIDKEENSYWARMRKSSYRIAFNWSGNIKWFDCLEESKVFDVTTGTYISVASGNIYVTVQNNSDSRNIALNQRFYVTNQPFKVTGIDKSQEGLIKLNCALDFINAEYDDVENSIVDRWRYEIDHTYSLTIDNGDAANVLINDIMQLNLLVTDNDSTVANPIVTFTSSDYNTVSVDNMGKVMGINLGQALITAKLKYHDAISDSITITTIETFTHSYTISITGSTIIYVGLSESYVAHIFDNGLEVFDRSVVWSIKNQDGTTSPAYASITTSTGNSDGSKESIESQKDVIKDFANELGIELVDIIGDNDISGYSYNRPGIKRIIELVDEGVLDILVTKGLSRIGRHNAKTLLFLEELEDKGVKLKLQSGDMDENFRGVQTWFNELYVKDISKKTKAALRTKQKNGEVNVTHFGYMKDPVDKTKCIIDEEAAETVRLLFRLYAEGNGLNKIAKYMNEHHVETPAIRKKNLYGYGWKKEWDYKHLWYSDTVKRILKDDVYIGTVRRGTTKRNKINGKKIIRVAPEEQFVHEGLIPAIIDKTEFEAVNAMFIKRVENGVRAKSNSIYKFTGLLKCGECGKNLVTIGSVSKSGRKLFYVCTTYNKYGKAYCSRHILSHDDIDSIIFEQLEALYKSGLLKMDNLDKSLEQRQQSNKDNGKVIERLQTAIHAKKGEIKNYSKQLAKELIREELFIEMTQEASVELGKMEQRLIEAESVQEVRDNEKEKVTSALDILKEIIDKKEFTHADLVMLIDKIVVYEQKSEGLDIEVEWNTPFMVVIE